MCNCKKNKPTIVINPQDNGTNTTTEETSNGESSEK